MRFRSFSHLAGLDREFIAAALSLHYPASRGYDYVFCKAFD